MARSTLQYSDLQLGSQADLAVLDARLTGRLDAVERRAVNYGIIADDASVRQIASQAQVATMQPAQQHPEPVNPEASSPSDPQPVANTVAAAPAETPAAPEAPSQSSTGLQQDSTRQGDPIDMSAILSAAVAAASEAGTAAATQAVAEAMQKEHGLYSALQEEMLDVKSKVQLLNQSAPAEVQEAQEVPQEAQETPQQGRQTQADSMEPSTEATAPSQEDLVAMQERLSSVEAAVKQAAQQVEEHLPQMRAVPHLETSLLTIQQSLAQLQSLAQPSQPSQPSQPQPTPSDAKTVTRTEEKAQATFCSELPEPAPEDAGRNKDMMALSDEELERLMARLQDVEELQEKAERRIQLLESRSREARSRSGSISLDRKSPAIRSTASKTSEPPSGGSLGGSWKDVQAELERFRKLFEFIEVRCFWRDAAEAMRFFNRRQAGADAPQFVDIYG
ncbi:unnamed protein product [Symbiodinium pilosum]|uniref:Uncharacterized protein n=1 Tax=Symbiodinium pilosum TaxID=2952 RepID=A0A812V8W7_SYMPI|nr:unnamed protein product [Symbiodinium pilosum]